MSSFLLQASTIATLLLLYIFPLPCTTAPIPSAYLRDEDSELMLNGGTYYLIRRNQGNGGGLTVVPSTGDSPCPLYITQEKNGSSNGIPVKITSYIRSKYLPYGTTDFTFVGVITTCKEPLVWRLSTDDATGQNYVVAGTPQSREPSAFSLVDPFNYVEPFQYQINFCNGSLCGRANILDESGLLAINTDLNFVVRFRKAFNDSPLLHSEV